MTFHAKGEMKSYKDMPQIWYQIQTKFRNEARPRSGIIRGRQFLMKDAYSFDSSWEGLDESYAKHYEAYKNILIDVELNTLLLVHQVEQWVVANLKSSW